MNYTLVTLNLKKSYDSYCKFETATNFLKRPVYLSSATSQFFFSKTRISKAAI